MKQHSIFALSAIAGFGLVAGDSFALEAKDLAGTWTLVSAGTFGTNPKMFDANGHIAGILMRNDLPKYKSNNRTQGTTEEYKATVEGSLSYFGTYKVSGTDLLLHIESSSFPNWNGADQKRANVTVSGDELKWTQPTPSGGGAAVEVVWKRAK